jgi:hypothetical protein
MREKPNNVSAMYVRMEKDPGSKFQGAQWYENIRQSFVKQVPGVRFAKSLFLLATDVKSIIMTSNDHHEPGRSSHEAFVDSLLQHRDPDVRTSGDNRAGRRR